MYILYVAIHWCENAKSGSAFKWSNVWTMLPQFILFVFPPVLRFLLVILMIEPLCKHKQLLRSAEETKNILHRYLWQKHALRSNYGALRQIVFDVDVTESPLFYNILLTQFLLFRKRVFVYLVLTVIFVRLIVRSWISRKAGKPQIYFKTSALSKFCCNFYKFLWKHLGIPFVCSFF